MKRALLLILSLLAALNLTAQSQVTVKGTVSDATGPVAGCAVLQQGTSNGTTTDLDGGYTLTVPAGAVIEYSCIGYETVARTAAASGTQDILLKEDSVLLEETVVIGYGVQKKSNVTGAISSLAGDEMKNRNLSNAASALQGKVSGVQVMNSSGAPGAAPAIRIRGYSSNGSSDPLYIVDGLKVSDISYLDPSSIQSMEILKDAASAAIYGAEAGNGVILITTRNGRDGHASVTFDASVAVNSLARKTDLMNAAQYIKFYTEREGAAFTSLYDKYNIPGTDTDWQDEMFGTGVTQNYNIGLEGGNDRGKFYAGLSYAGIDGMVRLDKDYYRRFSGQVNASYKIFKWLEAGTTNTISSIDNSSLTESNPLYGNLRDILLMDPLTPVYYTDDNMPSNLKAAVLNSRHLIKSEDGRYYGMSWAQNGINPLAAIDAAEQSNKGFTVNGASYLNITPLKGLVFTTRLGYTFSSTGSSSYNPTRLLKFLDTNNDNVLSLSTSNGTARYWQWENFANYLLDTGAGSFTFMLGTSYSNSEYSYSGTNTNALSSEASNFLYPSYSTNGADDYVAGSTTYQRKIAYFGRLGWDYEGRYNVQANFRADSYDSAYLDLDHNWGFFPSVSAGWTFSNEPFLRPAVGDVFSYGKLRLSYGVNGSISNLGGYMYAATLGAGQMDLSGATQNMCYYLDGALRTGIWPSETMANPSLRWERSNQFDAGLDLRFFSDRLTLTADCYYKLTDGLLVQSNAPYVSGATYVFQNLGLVANSGLEFELNWKDTIGEFSYGVNANFSTVSNTVKEYKGEGTRIEGSGIQGNPSASTYFEEGYPVWYIRGYKLSGVDPATGEAVFEDTDGVDGITDADKTYLGKAIPDFTYGITLTAAWKGFDLLVYGTGAQNFDLVYGLMSSDSGTRNNRPAMFYQDRWTASNTAAKYPSALYQVTDQRLYMSDMLVFDASFFKIKQIQLGYTLPKNLTSKLSISNLRVYASMDNWFTFTKYPGSDPEINAINYSASAMAIDFGGYPLSKSLSFGVNVTF